MLVYDQPINQARPDDRKAPQRSSAGLSVLELFRLVWRRRVAIVSVALICACLAVVIGKSLTPKYSATAQLYIDPRELQLVDRELTPRTQDLTGLAMVVESQARVITSNNVLLRVIRDTNLDKDPEFGGESRGVISSLLGLFGLGVHSDESRLDQNAALDALNRHISVRKNDRTFVVDIEVWSQDPAKAAMLANATSNAYLAETKTSQSTAARNATSDLSGRLRELQERLRNAENNLAVYKAQNNFVGTQDTLISDQQLSASNQRLAAAHSLTLDAQAKYDQIEASRRAATDAGAIPEALQSATIANLRAQYAEARKRYAEMTSELGPLHPSLRQMEKQVEDLRRTVNEEVERYAQSAKNDLTRARDFESSLNKALDSQKRQSVQLSQASVRLRELEREVEASRDVYQSFLKRSRETEEQEGLNTSSARIIGDATVPQRRSFPPPMSLLAILGFMLGALAAAGWTIAADRMPPEAGEGRARTPVSPDTRTETSKLPASHQPRQRPSVALIEKPLITRLQESDVMRTLGGILTIGGIPDLTRMGWPTLRAGSALTPFLKVTREMCVTLTKYSAANAAPVVALIGTGASQDRSIAALNFALAAARNGARVLMIDADPATHALSSKMDGLGNIGPGKTETSRLGWLNLNIGPRIGPKATRTIKTANGISILPVVTESHARANDPIRTAIAQARFTGEYDLVIFDGPPMPWSAADHQLLDIADGLVAILPAHLDINGCMEEIIAALGDAERKLVGVIINELHPTAVDRQRDRQYA
jgi:uncharacterized protein involved in exopolysaccharide biosynthesis/Mrp family chromosome partitioning ATPase